MPARSAPRCPHARQTPRPRRSRSHAPVPWADRARRRSGGGPHRAIGWQSKGSGGHRRRPRPDRLRAANRHARQTGWCNTPRQSRRPQRSPPRCRRGAGARCAGCSCPGVRGRGGCRGGRPGAGSRPPAAVHNRPGWPPMPLRRTLRSRPRPRPRHRRRSAPSRRDGPGRADRGSPDRTSPARRYIARSDIIATYGCHDAGQAACRGQVDRRHTGMGQGAAQDAAKSIPSTARSSG